MRRRRFTLAALLTALVAASTVYVLAGLHVYAQYQTAYRAYTLSCDGLLAWSPPTSVYTGLYVNQAAPVTVRVRSDTPDLAKVTVTIPGLTTPQVSSIQTNSTFQTINFKPPLLPPAELQSLVQAGSRSGQIVVTAQMSGRPVCQTIATVKIYSRQWMAWRDAATGADMAPYIAGWVTPRDPAVNALIGSASQRLSTHGELYGGLPSLFGYNDGRVTEEQARDEINALFDTLTTDYQLRYSSDNAPFTTSASQLIQAPGDVLGSVSPTGMCVETSVILASAVERLGMRPLLIFTATHAYLGVALGPGPAAPVAYWETSDLNLGVQGSQANIDGDAEYARDSAAHAVTDIVDITYERSQGIEPIE